MVKWCENIEKAILTCLEKAITFCVYVLPESKEIHFFSNPSFGSEARQLDGSTSFVIGEWCAKSKDFIYINDELDALETIRYGKKIPEKENLVPVSATNESLRRDYLKSINRIKEELSRREHPGKVVLSRSLNHKGLSSTEALELAKSLFDAFPHSFRHVYYTPITGAWMGATPELLIKYEGLSHSLTTMALAGTRSATTDKEPWDRKDILEQEIVTKYIKNILRRKKCEIVGEKTFTLTTGKLQHICTILNAVNTAEDSDAIPFSIIDALNPTPALCGFPKEFAKKLIKRLEVHKRHCYGGVIGLLSKNDITLFVNLRCMHFSRDISVIYAGGGILAQSNNLLEWRETEKKFESITSFLNK